MKDGPLFIKFLNNDVNYTEIIDSVINGSEDERTKVIAKNKRDEIIDISYFRSDFRNAVLDLIDNGITQKLINYVDSYMKPSLLEFEESNSGGRSGERRHVIIKEDDSPWVEAIICYNLCVYIRAFGIESIKQCKVCNRFFTHKGKYAKYCSDQCKNIGTAK